MQAFAQRPKTTRQTSPAKPAIPRRAHFGPSRDFSQTPRHPDAPANVQAKLRVNTPGDIYEVEADRVAEQVMRMTEPQLQRACPCGGGCPKCQGARPNHEHERLRTKRVQAGDTGQIAAPPIVHEVLRSPGQPLDATTRAFMEPRFGYDFSRVQVHFGGAAEKSAREVNAHAYTAGHNIVFAAGRFAPESREGRRLIAHELTHVVQQTTAVGHPVCDGYAAHGTETINTVSHAPMTVSRQSPPQPSPLVIPREGVDMPWVSKGGANSSELGYLRDPNYFWTHFEAQYGSQLSPANRTQIANGAAPVVDATWVQFHPEHAAYMGDVLEHHHVGQGSRAVPLPSRLHDAYTVFHP